IAKLEKEIAAGTGPMQKHDLAMRKYFAALKQLKPRLATADKLPTTGTGGDTPWKAEREAYDAQKALVIAAQDGHDFEKANAELVKLAKATDDVIKKRLEKVSEEVAKVTNTNSGGSK